MTEIEIIKNSNTIFSTLVCPKCGKPLKFDIGFDSDENEEAIEAHCAAACKYENIFTINAICKLLNNNGINCLVRNSPKSADYNESNIDNGFFNKR